MHSIACAAQVNGKPVFYGKRLSRNTPSLYLRRAGLAVRGVPAGFPAAFFHKKAKQVGLTRYRRRQNRRDRKNAGGEGKSLVALPVDYVVVDTETTGLEQRAQPYH